MRRQSQTCSSFTQWIMIHKMLLWRITVNLHKTSLFLKYSSPEITLIYEYHYHTVDITRPLSELKSVLRHTKLQGSVSHTSNLMAFISQHCKTPALLLRLFDVKVDISLYFEKDWDNLNGDVKDFLLVAAEHTKAPPVGLHDSDTILKTQQTLRITKPQPSALVQTRRRLNDFENGNPSFNFHVMIKWLQINDIEFELNVVVSVVCSASLAFAL